MGLKGLNLHLLNSSKILFSFAKNMRVIIEDPGSFIIGGGVSSNVESCYLLYNISDLILVKDVSD